MIYFQKKELIDGIVNGAGDYDKSLPLASILDLRYDLPDPFDDYVYDLLSEKSITKKSDQHGKYGLILDVMPHTGATAEDLYSRYKNIAAALHNPGLVLSIQPKPEQFPGLDAPRFTVDFFEALGVVAEHNTIHAYGLTDNPGAELYALWQPTDFPKKADFLDLVNELFAE